MPKKFSADTAESMSAIPCPGRSDSWGAKFWNEPHEAHHRYSPCWACGADLGCARCSGPRDELLCMKESGRRGNTFYGHGKIRGPVWATVEAFVKHGLFLGQKLNDYPPEWQFEYRKTA